MEKEIVRFVLHEPREALWQFKCEYYNEDGELVRLIAGRTKTGEDIPATVKFHAGKRMISYPATKRDIHGNSYIDFLKNSPYCKGSKTCAGEGKFFLYNPEKDAEVAIDEARERLRAEMAAIELSGSELKEMANYFGEFSKDAKVQKAVVLDNARIKYREFNDKVGTPEVSNTAIFNAGLNKGLVIKKGFLFEVSLNGTKKVIGNSKDAAIATIATDKELRQALESHLEEK